MKSILHLCLAPFLAAILTGCSTTYLTDRWRDGLDICNVSIGLGAGAKARVSLVQTGLIYEKDFAGLRNGAGFAVSPSLDAGSDNQTGSEIGVISFGAEVSNSGGAAEARGKQFSTMGVFIPQGWWYTDKIGELPAHYHTQIEAVAGLGLVFRVGFNPGELADFLLGWTTLDLFQDDTAARKKKRAAGKPADKAAPSRSSAQN
jgi:hypothetical protein